MEQNEIADIWLTYQVVNFSSSQFVGLDNFDRHTKETNLKFYIVALLFENLFGCETELHEKFDQFLFA